MATLPSNHLYHAHALAVAGKVMRPNPDSLNAPAAVTLSPIGGYSSERHDKFEFKGIVSIESMFVEVAGSYDDNNTSHTTLSSVVIEGLNIQNVVTADRVVARLAARHQADGKWSSGPVPEAHVVPTGSHFENLKIAGRPVNVELATALFSTHNTYQLIDDAYKNKSPEIEQCVLVKQLEKVDLKEHPKLVSFMKGLDKLPDVHNMHWCSLVSRDTIAKDPGSECKCFGSVICVPHFGRIHLAEFIVEKGARRLNMLRIHMGSPVEADFMVGSAFSDGTTYPPSSGTGT